MEVWEGEKGVPGWRFFENFISFIWLVAHLSEHSKHLTCNLLEKENEKPWTCSTPPPTHYQVTLGGILKKTKKYIVEHKKILDRKNHTEIENVFKGEVRRFFYRLKGFIGLKLREVWKGNFHRKAPKWAKNQVKVSNIDQIRPPLHPTYCGNPPIPSSELLWESTSW